MTARDATGFRLIVDSGSYNFLHPGDPQLDSWTKLPRKELNNKEKTNAAQNSKDSVETAPGNRRLLSLVMVERVQLFPRNSNGQKMSTHLSCTDSSNVPTKGISWPNSWHITARRFVFPGPCINKLLDPHPSTPSRGRPSPCPTVSGLQKFSFVLFLLFFPCPKGGSRQTDNL